MRENSYNLKTHTRTASYPSKHIELKKGQYHGTHRFLSTLSMSRTTSKILTRLNV